MPPGNAFARARGPGRSWWENSRCWPYQGSGLSNQNTSWLVFYYFSTDPCSFDIVRHPVLGLHDSRFVLVPAVDAIELTGAEMIVFAPFDRAAAQSPGIDFYVLHCRAQLAGIGWRARCLERRLKDHSADP